ncbi:MAG: flavodoxin family protein [Tannerellaceae bacterium]|nr:flavodoxin family protein [Tannerellaceae bacterium]
MSKSKKIIILNGSPRKKGNTAALIDAFTQGAESAGHSVTTFFINGMNIHGCIGCLKGGKDPHNPCVQKDDMGKIYPVYEAADLVVLASPMYFWSITGQLKGTFDRLFAVAEKDPAYQAPKRSVLCLWLPKAQEMLIRPRLSSTIIHSSVFSDGKTKGCS